jgi:hypothetical protein
LTGAVRVTLAPAAQFTSSALMRIEQPAKVKGVGAYRTVRTFSPERGGLVVPLSKVPTTVELVAK